MKTKTFIITVALIGSIGTAAFAHKDVSGIIKERMDGMMAMGKALKSVGNMFKGKTEFDATKIGAASDIVLEHASGIEKLFPDTKESREGKGSEALPIVWSKRDEFLAIAKELEKRAAELKAVAASGDKNKTRASFANLAKSCSSCHADYRKPKK